MANPEHLAILKQGSGSGTSGRRGRMLRVVGGSTTEHGRSPSGLTSGMPIYAAQISSRRTCLVLI